MATRSPLSLWCAVKVELVNLKPGVLFLQTSSGGVLMDIAADRFLALAPLSAALWSSLASGHGAGELIEKIMNARGVSCDQAKALLTQQLEVWRRVELLSSGPLAVALPQPKVSPTRSSIELSIDAFRFERLVPWLAASLLIVELKYRRVVVKLGLAKALVSLQAEFGRAAKVQAKVQQAVIVRTVRNYHALRRAFRQGDEARDCLFSSLERFS